jgi:signal transduction histidine kinase
MKLFFQQKLVLRGALALIWVLVAVVLAMLGDEAARAELDISLEGLLFAWLAWLAFGVLFIVNSRVFSGQPVHRPWAAIVAMSLLTILISVLTNSGLGGVLVFMLACLVPWLTDMRSGLYWLVAQQLGMGLAIWLLTATPWMNALIIIGVHSGFSAFVFAMSLTAIREARARQQLRKLNAELRAAQALLNESSKVGERLRISRELHDLVGHHLTALSLNLEVAGHLTEGKANEHVNQCKSLAKLLLSDVRQVVGDMRERARVDLQEALRSLAEGVPSPQVHLDFSPDFALDDPNQAHALLRCVQEVITNTMKHAEADNLWIEFHRDEGGVSFQARDDGKGGQQVTAGNGLTGMRERLQQFGGDLSVEARIGRGFLVNGWMPEEVATS